MSSIRSDSYLQNGHLVPQLALLLGGEPHFVDDFDRHVSAALSVFTCRGREGRDGILALC